jgi:glycosyltransferase involved in cell wall biosynthesis
MVIVESPRGTEPIPGAPGPAPIVDIVVPVHDEGRVLAASIERLHGYLADRFPFSWRITIADNASTDDTAVVAADLSARLSHVRAMHLDEKGRGRALRTAWTASDATVVAYMDVDLSTDLDALLPLVAPLVSGHSDIAIGCRLSPAASVARAPKRELISRTYNLLLRSVLATRIHDAQCGFKAVRADIARRLLPAVQDDGWFFDTELLLLAEHNNLRIHQVPVDWIDDPDSRVDLASTALGDVRGSLRLFRTFTTGGGVVTFRHPRPTLADDFGRRIVSFGVIGTVSTLVSLALYLLLRAPLGAVGANAVALTVTLAANTWLNARYTLRRRRPRWGRTIALYVAALAGTSAVLWIVQAAGIGSSGETALLMVSWIGAGLARFAFLGPEKGRWS